MNFVASRPKARSPSGFLRGQKDPPVSVVTGHRRGEFGNSPRAPHPKEGVRRGALGVGRSAARAPSVPRSSRWRKSRQGSATAKEPPQIVSRRHQRKLGPHRVDASWQESSKSPHLLDLPEYGFHDSLSHLVEAATFVGRKLVHHSLLDRSILIQLRRRRLLAAFRSAGRHI